MSTSKPATPRQVPPPAGKPAAPAYTRFIPREELGTFSAWMPGEFAPTGEAPAPPPETDADTADARVAQARQSGYQDGYRDGLAALDSFKQSFAQQMSERIGALLRGFDEEFAGLEQQMAAAVAQTATLLARQVVREELSLDPQRIARVAQEALSVLLSSARQVTLRVHPDDEPLVRAGAGDALAVRSARLVADAGIARGGCRVEADIGAVDATVQTRWRRALGADLRLDEDGPE